MTTGYGAERPDHNRELVARAQAGDKSARDELVRANLRLVGAVARRFQRPGADYDDLFQVGCIGLMKAVDGFDLRYAVRFSTYAVPVIAGEIRQYMRAQHPVRLPRKLDDMRRQVAACRETLTNRWSREPTIGEIAEELGAPREDVVAALEADLPVASLDEPVGAGEGESIVLGDRLAADGGQERMIENAALRVALAGLEEWERRLVVLRFFEEHSQTETARLLGVSQAHVSRMERRILRRFRDTFA